jgi:hypothetical protein
MHETGVREKERHQNVLRMRLMMTTKKKMRRMKMMRKKMWRKMNERKMRRMRMRRIRMTKMTKIKECSDLSLLLLLLLLLLWWCCVTCLSLCVNVPCLVHSQCVLLTFD